MALRDYISPTSKAFSWAHFLLVHLYIGICVLGLLVCVLALYIIVIERIEDYLFLSPPSVLLPCCVGALILKKL